jgi:phospholipid transport system substrate-binding protein
MKTNNFFNNQRSFSMAKMNNLLISLIFASMCLTAFANPDNTKVKTTNAKSTKEKTTKSVAKTKKSGTVRSDSQEDLTIADSVDCEEGTPCIVVSSTSKQVLSEVNSNRISAVTHTVTPHFDFRLMTKYALGNNWKSATEDQREQLVELFKELLIYTYSTALSKFGGSKINITSSTINANGKTAVVVSQVSLPSSATNNTSQPVKVEYNLANTTGAWMAYDIKIENASLVTTYRNQFNEIVQKEQISGLIKQLQTKVKQLQTRSGSLKEITTADDNS